MRAQIKQILTVPTHTFDTVDRSKHLHPAVYALHHKKTGKVYVGKTSCFYDRMKQHKSSLRYGKHENRFLQEAYDDDPAISIAFVECSGEEATELEQKLIDLLSESEIGFNIAIDSEKPAKGLSLSDEHKEAIRSGSNAYWSSTEARGAQSERSKRLWKDPSYVSKIRSGWENLSEEQKKKIAYERSVTFKAVMNDPDFQEKRRVALEKLFASDAYKKAKSELLKRKNADPEFKRKSIVANINRGRPVSVNGVVYKTIRIAEKETGMGFMGIRKRALSPKHPDFFFLDDPVKNKKK